MLAQKGTWDISGVSVAFEMGCLVRGYERVKLAGVEAFPTTEPPWA
jgi:hypothetical protein